MPTLNFKGKTFVQNHHLAVKYHQLVPKAEYSLTDKVSLRQPDCTRRQPESFESTFTTYAGKVKCIYIDPPYNTETKIGCIMTM